ncbi:hypothetical protein TCAL_01485 [Tigriopus californicus]|uniref:Sushi, von Willebrand factor type A, EGF and pentraxin domain-containing protein 1 n=1 Tax=Tigriopus californicus TaxID=6832 RepID=A0A553N6Y9_TIGCA|nr:hypothetical protein TCAL_01485 [Tigriopus californicus]
MKKKMMMMIVRHQPLSAECGFPGAPAHSSVKFNTEGLSEDEWRPGTVARYSCDRGFELLGPARRICGENGTWAPQGIPFCVLNVAAGKAPMQSSVVDGGIPQKAVDGSTSTFFDESTCSLTDVERAPWWYVNLLEPYMVQLVRIDFGQSCCAKDREATIVVRVGNNRPDLGVNPICNRFTGSLEEGRPLFLPCNPPMPGAFVSVHFEGPPGVSLSICEAFVYTDQALPIERCPTYRDQPPGSTATYNGKCYIFYNQQPSNFQDAQNFCESRGGSLVDESNPALQGFLSWELWRRHKGDANGQYWLGAVRDRDDPKNWKWINGKPVSVSFWNLPGGNDDCARFDGTKGWLWSDTNCGLNLNFICQHRPTTCGKPEQPPNSTLISTSYEVGSRIEYICNEGHLLVGPSKRSCLPTGFYSEFPPVCRFLQCGPPADVENAVLSSVNGTRQFKSLIQYECDPGYVMVGRPELMCDVDEKWNGPPPRCEPVYCEEPLSIRNGGFSLSTNSTRFGTVASYYCTSSRHELVGSPKLVCQPDGGWNARPPRCEPIMIKPRPPKLAPKPPTIDVPLPSPESNFPRNRDRRPPFLQKPRPDPASFKPRPRRPPFTTNDDGFSARPPIDNEIPDSANVQANPGPRADEPSSVANDNPRETRQAQLNLGGIIALGVFGGFVFLAAIITTIVILIRSRRDLRPLPTLPRLTNTDSSRWYTLLALPDQPTLARRDLNGFRPRRAPTAGAFSDMREMRSCSSSDDTFTPEGPSIASMMRDSSSPSPLGRRTRF